MLANFSWVDTSTDVDELVISLGHVKEATRNFADLGDRFRKAISCNSTPRVLKHDINSVFAVQAGDLLCQCWRRGMLSVYRPHFYFPEESEPRIRYVFSWFMFIRWHLATIFKTRFRDDWKSEFAPEMDQLKGLDHHSQRDYQSAASDDANDLVVWRLNLYADVQATACDILAEELRQLAEAVEQRLRQLPKPPSKSIERDEAEAVARRLNKDDVSFVCLTAKDMAKLIQQASGKSCSPTLVKGLPFWKEAMQRTSRGRKHSGAKGQGKTRGTAGRSINLSNGLEAVTGEGKKWEVLESLADAEDQTNAERAMRQKMQAIDFVSRSRLGDEEKRQTIAKLQEGEMTPEQATEMVSVCERDPKRNRKKSLGRD